MRGDPREDTESAEEQAQEQKGASCMRGDPREDTERPVHDKYKNTDASRCMRGDPREDTERH